jgi:hypothetical protein
MSDSNSHGNDIERLLEVLGACMAGALPVGGLPLDVVRRLGRRGAEKGSREARIAQ